MIFENLTKIFDGELVDFGDSSNIRVCLENIDCPTDGLTPYLSGFMLLASTEQADLYFNDRRPGVYQVDINYPSNKGSACINKIADSLNQLFSSGTDFTFNDICATVITVDLGPLLVENGFATRPLSINFESYTQRVQ